jgi:hypothetical protein
MVLRGLAKMVDENLSGNDAMLEALKTEKEIMEMDKTRRQSNKVGE